MLLVTYLLHKVFSNFVLALLIAKHQSQRFFGPKSFRPKIGFSQKLLNSEFLDPTFFGLKEQGVRIRDNSQEEGTQTDY